MYLYLQWDKNDGIFKLIQSNSSCDNNRLTILDVMSICLARKRRRQRPRQEAVTALREKCMALFVRLHANCSKFDICKFSIESYHFYIHYTNISPSFIIIKPYYLF